MKSTAKLAALALVLSVLTSSCGDGNAEWLAEGVEEDVAVADDESAAEATAAAAGLSLAASADAYVRSGAFARTNFGREASVRVDGNAGGSTERGLLRFALPQSVGVVRRAWLELAVTNGTANGIEVYATTGPSWSETAVTWDTQPEVGSAPTCAGDTISNACVCGGAVRVEGFCCEGTWFEPAYGRLAGGCPRRPYFHVDPSHPQAADTGSGSAQQPWRTLQHAVATVRAGETVVVHPGTYTAVPGYTRHTPIFNPANSGSPGAPVVIKGLPGAVVRPAVSVRGAVLGASGLSVQLDANASTAPSAYAGWYLRITDGAGAGQARRIGTYDGSTRTVTVLYAWGSAPDATSRYALTRPGTLIGTNARQHVVWDGFTVYEDDAYARDTGPVVLWASSDVALLGSEIVAQTVEIADNHNAVRVEGTTRALVRNNVLRGVLGYSVGQNNPQNHAAVMIYSSQDCVFEHNLVYDSYTGFFPKGGNAGHVFRYNLVRDVTKAFRVSYHQRVDITQNVIVRASIALQQAENNSGIRFFNNVVDSSRTGVNNWFASNGLAVFNNVFSRTPAPYSFEGEPGDFTADWNGFAELDDFVFASRRLGGLPGVQATGRDLHSFVGPVPFVAPSVLDFHLDAGAAAFWSGGRDLADTDGDGVTDEAVPLGAYLTGREIIGPRPARR